MIVVDSSLFLNEVIIIDFCTETVWLQRIEYLAQFLHDNWMLVCRLTIVTVYFTHNVGHSDT
jgi:predicted Rdx family selenoprotein